MKKQLLGFVLFFSLSLTAMDRFNRIRNISPTLSAILKRKFIDKQPLTKQQEAYLQKVKKRTLIAGLVALGVGAVTIAGYLARRKGSAAQKSTKDPVFTKEQYIEKIEEAEGINVSFLLGDLSNAYYHGNRMHAQNYVEAKKPGLLESKGLKAAPF